MKDLWFKAAIVAAVGYIIFGGAFFASVFKLIDLETCRTVVMISGTIGVIGVIVSKFTFRASAS